MKKKVAIIAAISHNGVYDEGGTIPWYIPKDLQYSKNITTDHTAVMGRKTWESLPEKVKPLPNCVNIVVTTTPDYKAEGAQVVLSVKQAIDFAPTENVFCVGGHGIWYEALLLKLVDELWITLVHGRYPETSRTRFARELINPAAQHAWSKFCCEDYTPFDSESPAFSVAHWVRSEK